MKKLTAEEKIVRVREEALVRNQFQLSERVQGVIDCPYGDSTHWRTSFSDAEQNCKTCDRLDGSECVDEFLREWDFHFASGTAGRGRQLDAALARVREWRAGKQ